MRTYKITLALVRSFGVGLTVHSPKLNGVSFEFQMACFLFRFWAKGKKFIVFVSYWNG